MAVWHYGTGTASRVTQFHDPPPANHMQQQGFVRQVGELGHWAIGATPLWSVAAFSRAVIC